MKNDGASARRYTPLTSSSVATALTDVERQTRAFVEQRPVVAVMMALGLGLVVGRLAIRH